MENRKSFTLAEVLITLSILGVVAAISIPNVIQQYQKRLTITKLQKAYANLEQATTNIAISSGCYGKDISCIIDQSSENETPTDIFKYAGFKYPIIKNPTSKSAYYLYCEDNNSCKFYESIYLRNTYYKIIDTANKIEYIPYIQTIYTNGKNNEKGILITVLTTSKSNEKLILGRNAFVFLIYGNFQLSPAKGCFGSTICPTSHSGDYDKPIIKNCSKDSSVYGSDAQPGISCAAKIIQDGWKINY